MKRSFCFFVCLALTLLPGIAIMTNPTPAEAKTLNFALAGNPDTLDPHKTSGTLTFQTIKSFYDTLEKLSRPWQKSGKSPTMRWYGLFT